MDFLHSPGKVIIAVDFTLEHSGSFIMPGPKYFSEEHIGRFKVLPYSFLNFVNYYLLLPGNVNEQSLKRIFGNSGLCQNSLKGHVAS